ncbi:MAG: stage III sporulation AC/AD family protein, partial [Ruminococcus sp.]|nr:stage III sporulation AC/AD family protein [Ruminococcus sp.]
LHKIRFLILSNFLGSVQTDLPGSYLAILWKALGVCYLTGIAGDLCRDCGETALAQMAELWGRLSLVLLSLPLLEALLETVTGVLS